MYPLNSHVASMTPDWPLQSACVYPNWQKSGPANTFFLSIMQTLIPNKNMQLSQDGDF
jgi:hypothetical protein